MKSEKKTKGILSIFSKTSKEKHKPNKPDNEKKKDKKDKGYKAGVDTLPQTKPVQRHLLGFDGYRPNRFGNLPADYVPVNIAALNLSLLQSLTSAKSSLPSAAAASATAAYLCLSDGSPFGTHSPTISRTGGRLATTAPITTDTSTATSSSKSSVKSLSMRAASIQVHDEHNYSTYT